MSDWKSENELFELIKARLYTPFGKLTEALKNASGENLVRREIENGMSSTAAFQKYGIL